jgi:hypothetical protein
LLDAEVRAVENQPLQYRLDHFRLTLQLSDLRETSSRLNLSLL